MTPARSLCSSPTALGSRQAHRDRRPAAHRRPVSLVSLTGPRNGREQRELRRPAHGGGDGAGPLERHPRGRRQRKKCGPASTRSSRQPSGPTATCRQRALFNVFETLACLPAQNTGKFAPDAGSVAVPDGRGPFAQRRAADAGSSAPTQARCSRLSTGETAGEHGAGSPAGAFSATLRRERDHRLDASTLRWRHRDILAMAMEGGSDRA